MLSPESRGELLDLALGMRAHPLQDVHQVGVGIDAVHLARDYQTLKDADVFGTDFRPAKQPILSFMQSSA